MNLLFAFLGAALTYLATAKYGIGVTPDSVEYLAAAQSFSNTGAFKQVNGSPFTAWPPLMPLTISLLIGAGVDPLVGVRLLNSVVFGLVILISAKLASSILNNKIVNFTFLLILVSSIPLYRVSVMMWSELVFILLTLLFILQFTKEEPSDIAPFRIWSITIITALAMLQRFVGVTLFVAGILLILRQRDSKKRTKDLLIFSLSTVPLLLWLWRNYLLSGTLTGGRGIAESTLINVLEKLSLTITLWFLPKSSVAALPYWFTVALLIGALIGTLVLTASKTTNQTIRALSTFFFIYAVFIIICTASFKMDQISDRLLSPIYIPLILLMLLCIQTWTIKVKEKVSIVLALYAILFSLTAWQSYRYVQNFKLWREVGVGGFSTRLWHDAPITKWLKTNRVQGNVFSNIPEYYYLITGQTAAMLPTGTAKLTQQNLAGSDLISIIWFSLWKRGDPSLLNKLARETQLAVLYHGPDGEVVEYKK